MLPRLVLPHAVAEGVGALFGSEDERAGAADGVRLAHLTRALNDQTIDVSAGRRLEAVIDRGAALDDERHGHLA